MDEHKNIFLHKKGGPTSGLGTTGLYATLLNQTWNHVEQTKSRTNSQQQQKKCRNSFKISFKLNCTAPTQYLYVEGRSLKCHPTQAKYTLTLYIQELNCKIFSLTDCTSLTPNLKLIFKVFIMLGFRD